MVMNNNILGLNNNNNNNKTGLDLEVKFLNFPQKRKILMVQNISGKLFQWFS